MKASIVAALLAASSVVSAASLAQTAPPPEPRVQRIVLEDEGARIEELRVRGLTQRVVIKPKNAAEYEIVPAPGGRDPSQNRANANPGAGGQRVWNLLKF
jgi:hypothetical protein